MDPVTVGLVGYGFGGRYFHAPLIAAAAECRFLGVVTTSPERRDLVAAEHQEAGVFDSLASLAAAGAEAVSISTPADTHSALTDEAIGLGLSVVCDKPFSLDPAAARRSVGLAAARGVTLSPYQNRRWDSDFLTVRALVDDGTLGEVHRFESRFERYAPANGPGRSGGGTLLDFGAHLVDQALTLLGPVESVHAESRTRESGLDDDVFVALRHSDGAVSHLWGSWSQHAPGPRFRVTGSAASLVVTTGDTQEDVLVTGARPSPDVAWGVEQDSDLDRLSPHRDRDRSRSSPAAGTPLPDVRAGGPGRGPSSRRGGRRRGHRGRPRGRPPQRRTPYGGPTGSRPVTGRRLLDELEAQESRLVFDHFDDDTAWDLGVGPARDGPGACAARGDLDPPQRPAAVPRGAARGPRPTTTAGSRARAPSSTATAAHRSGWPSSSASRAGPSTRTPGWTRPSYAAHGGAFPILVRGTGCVGTVAISGLPQLEDHRLLVETLEAFLAARQRRAD